LPYFNSACHHPELPHRLGADVINAAPTAVLLISDTAYVDPQLCPPNFRNASLSDA
jgi:hypothetical protein